MTPPGVAPTLRMALVTGALVVALPAAAVAAPVDASDSDHASGPFVPAQILVRYDRGTTKTERAEVRNSVDADLEQKLLVPRLELLSLPPGDSVRDRKSVVSGKSDVRGDSSLVLR